MYYIQLMGTSVSFMILCWWLCMVAAFDLVEAKARTSDCVPSSCGHIQEIRHPFRLKSDPQHCGESAYTLSCENNFTIINRIKSSATFYLQEINYDNLTIRAVDASILNNNGTSIPTYSVTDYMLEYLNTPIYFVVEGDRPSDFNSEWLENCIPPQNKSAGGSGKTCSGSYPIYFLQCKNPVNSSVYLDTAPCYNSSPNTHGYVKINSMEVGELKDGCSIERMSFVHLSQDWDASCKYIQRALLYGFEMTYLDDLGDFCGKQWATDHKCFPKNFTGFFRFLGVLIYRIRYLGGFIHRFFSSGHPAPYEYSYFHGKYIDFRIASLVGIGLVLVGRFIFLAPVLLVPMIYIWRRRHLSMYNTIEEFLHGENNFVPVRYSYSDIKKMAKNFKEKLGEGGYGCVFKAKLRSGRYGAIKILGKPKANGEEFIREVATIGRIHHVNVVQLIGYCVEGSKRALVYDFMPNGSLEKYIYSKEGIIPLSIQQIYEISLGVARGIEYLHQGCDIQILHFDIKPHNILLDQNFAPKISDFGLAKLCPTDNSIVSLTAARGTMGYIAPELFYKNIGGVSNRADVYSFGMLLIEMASKRKNFKAMVEHSSQTYFPSWVYDQYNQGKYHLEMGNVTDEERKITTKMVMTGLWCIQMRPSDRPSINKVIEMLEGDVEGLQMPNKPFLYQQAMHVDNPQDTSLNLSDSPAELTCTLSAR